MCRLGIFLVIEDNSFVPLKLSALVRPGLSSGNEKLDLRNLQKECSHLENVVADVIDYSKNAVILGQDVFSAICPIGYRTSNNHFSYGQYNYPSGGLLVVRCPIAIS